MAIAAESGAGGFTDTGAGADTTAVLVREVVLHSDSTMPMRHMAIQIVLFIGMYINAMKVVKCLKAEILPENILGIFTKGDVGKWAEGHLIIY